jgi:predicted small integral membrane protein
MLPDRTTLSPAATAFSSTPTGPEGLARWGRLPVVLAVLTAISAAYYLLVAFGNITDYTSNEPFVRAVVGMSDGFSGKGITDPDLTWRRISEPWVQTGIYWLIIGWEVLTGLVLAWATVAWVRALRTRRGVTTARGLSTLGWLMGVLLFFGGFLTVGGEWWAMWQNSTFNGQEPAFRNSILALAGILLAHLPSPDWADRGSVADPESSTKAPVDDSAQAVDQPAGT